MPLLMTLDSGPRCIGSLREVLCTFQHAPRVHHPTVGAWEWNSRVDVLSVPCWVVQGMTAVVIRHPSSDQVPLALCMISSARSVTPQDPLPTLYPTLYFAALLSATAAELPPRGPHAEIPAWLHCRISRGTAEGGPPKEQRLCEAGVIPNAYLPSIDINLGGRPPLLVLGRTTSEKRYRKKESTAPVPCALCRPRRAPAGER